ncbi:MAG: hypothetical protein H0T54_00500, partial [Geodermatophilaceae bacterium]|nr:hypothetical protein [Geodermatophilaceae bacterium]
MRRLEFNGVSKAVDLDELRASIATESTRCTSAILSLICRFSRFRGFEERHYLDRHEFKRDVLRIRVFYFRHGFREAQVDTAITKIDEKRVAVRFDIVEGPPTMVTDVAVAYDSTLLSGRRRGQLILLHAGEPLDLFVLDSTRVGLQNEMWEQGYADALIDTSTVIDPVARTARVQLRIVPNHKTTVGDIVITGTSAVSPLTVLHSLSFRPGDLFKRSDVIESQRNLYESNLFRLVALEVPESFDSVKTVQVLVREAP